MTTKINRVLAAVSEDTTVSEIAQETGFDQHYIRNALRMLRAYGQVVRTNEGLPPSEAGLFSITQVGRNVIAELLPLGSVEHKPAVPMVHQAIAKRPFLATMWTGA